MKNTDERILHERRRDKENQTRSADRNACRKSAGMGAGERRRVLPAIDDAADACNETAGQYLTPGHGYKTGEYKRHFAIERQLTGRHSYSATWHVEAPYYRLTHLLENGHLTRDGTKRTKAVKHIKYGRQIAEQVLDEKMKGLWE